MFARFTIFVVLVCLIEINSSFGDEPVIPAFSFMRDGKVWVMDEEGKQQKPIVTDLYYKLNRPIGWSHSGSHVYYWNHVPGGWNIWSVDVKTSKTKNLTNAPRGGCRSHCVSPDGKWIAYMRDYKGGVYVMQTDGSTPRRVTKHGHRDISPTWSPDGKSLAYVVIESNRTMIYVVNFDGSNDRRLAKAADDPQWSKDGKSILCSARGKKNGTST